MQILVEKRYLTDNGVLTNPYYTAAVEGREKSDAFRNKFFASSDGKKADQLWDYATRLKIQSGQLGSYESEIATGFPDLCGAMERASKRMKSVAEQLDPDVDLSCNSDFETCSSDSEDPEGPETLNDMASDLEGYVDECGTCDGYSDELSLIDGECHTGTAKLLAECSALLRFYAEMLYDEEWRN